MTIPSLLQDRFRLLTAISALICVGPALGAAASAYPERPVRLVLGFPPGGTSDTMARVITPRLHTALGQPWVIDNRGGAAGNIATEIVVRANPDGHTVLLALSSMITVSPTLYTLPFNVDKELRPVTLLASSQYMLVTHPSIKSSTVKQFIEVAKARQGKLNYASAGIGSPHHLAGELFKLRARVDMTHVPYKGGGPASAAVLGNEVQALFGSIASLIPHVKAKRINALAVTGPSRSASIPEIPTIAESGFPGFDVSSWQGFLVPAGTPQHIVNSIHETTAKILAMSDVREALGRIGLEIIAKDPKQFAAHIRTETRVWTELIKSANIKLN